MAVEQFSNNANSSLTSSINNTSNPVTFTVASATNYPTSGNFRVLIDAEILKVTAVSGTSFTASRAQEGTTIAAHSIGAAVTEVLTAGALNQTFADRTLFGTYANIPTAGIAGRTYKCTDSGYIAYDNGTSWTYFWGGFEVTPPPSSGYSWINQSNASVVTTQGTIRLSSTTNNAGNQSRNVYWLNRTSLTTPYTIVWGFLAWPGESNQNQLGVCITDGTNLQEVMLYNAVNNTNLVQVEEVSGYNDGGSALYSTANFWQYTAPLYVQCVNDGTHITWSCGPSPLYFPKILYQNTSGAYLTPTGYGIYLNELYDTGAMELFHLSGP